MANYRLTELQRTRRIRVPLYPDGEDLKFAKRLASLTIMIARQIAREADTSGMTFDSPVIDVDPLAKVTQKQGQGRDQG